jgi:hypothetical protein
MNLRELFSKYPLGCESFGAEWLRRWEAIGRLLDAPARVEVFCPPRGEWYAADMDPEISCGAAIVDVASIIHKKRRRVRVALLDGAIVREWPAI